jgi:hypothetical protein
MSKIDLGNSYDQFVFLQTFRNNPMDQSSTSMGSMNKSLNNADSDTFDDLRMEEECEVVVADTENNGLHRVKASTPLSDSDSQGYATNRFNVAFSPTMNGAAFSPTNNGTTSHSHDTNGEVVMCSKCAQKEATMMNDCEHMLVCNKCAMKMATGGKCKVCKQFFGSFRAMRRSRTKASEKMMDSDSD